MFPDEHQKRVNKTFKEIFNSNPGFIINDIVNPPEEFSKGVIKCRFIYDKDSYSTEFSKYNKRNVRSLKLIYDDTISYDYKFYDRDYIQKSVLQKDNCDEIIFIKKSFFTDTSFSNLIFWDGREWFTPDTYLLNGTCRKRLLESGEIKEANININNFRNFSGVKLINAMLYPDDTEIISVENICV